MVSASQPCGCVRVCAGSVSGCDPPLFSDSSHAAMGRTKKLSGCIGKSGVSSGSKEYLALHAGLSASAHRAWASAGSGAQQA